MTFMKSAWKYIHLFVKNYSGMAKAIGFGVLGLIVLWLLVRLLNKSLQGRIPSHLRILITKIIRYGGLVVLASTVLTQLGFNITALLGAAGVVGVAIGFASQTSVSNIISGMFLIIEHPFQINDLIHVGSEVGYVETIDLLAVRLRTPDGRLVRIPNETLIKSNVINRTFYKSRRITLFATVDRKHDIQQVLKITQSVLEQSSVVRKDKAPSVWIDSYSLWTIDLGIWAWINARDVSGDTAKILTDLYNEYKKENLTVSVVADQ